MQISAKLLRPGFNWYDNGLGPRDLATEGISKARIVVSLAPGIDGLSGDRGHAQFTLRMGMVEIESIIPAGCQRR